MEEDLVVISRSMVKPRNVDKSSSAKKTKIHLTPWDLARLRFGNLQRGLLFPKPDQEIEIVISRLQTSLSVALDHFYPLAGRLVKVENEDDHTVSFYITCDGSGVEFVHAVAKNIEVSDVLRLPGSVPGFLSSFFPATGIKNYNGVSRSLLMVQVTDMKDGVFIGFGYNSTVADGNSIWKFVNEWSEICSKDLGSETFQPRQLHLKGWFFEGIDYPIHITDPETKVYATSADLQEKMFHVTKENVLKLEGKANGEVDQKISSIQAVLGHIWRLMIKHSGMSREEETHCRLPVNMRRRLNPPLKDECFGNVSQTGIAKVTVGDLLDRGLGWAAAEIKDMVKLQTDENTKELAEKWVNNIKIPVSVGSKDLVVTNSHQFDVYSNDFGWGKPIAARAGPPYVNGRLVVFQGVRAGSLDFQACLSPEVVEKLSMDIEFKSYVSIMMN